MEAARANGPERPWLILNVRQRKMKALALLAVVMAILCIGCVALKRVPDVDVAIVNLSSRELDDAEAQFGDHVCRWEIVGRTFTKGYGFYPHPITEETVLRWREEGRGPRAEKIDLRSIYPKGAAGRLTFAVSDDGVRASFRPK